MKKDDLIDSMGRIDDDLVEHVDALRQKKKKPRWPLFAVLAACLALVIAAGAVLQPWAGQGGGTLAGPEEQPTTSGSEAQPTGTGNQVLGFPVGSTARIQLLDFSAGEEDTPVTPSVQPYSASAGLANVINLDQFDLTDEKLQLLEQNLFVVSGSYYHEFFEAYESNRYEQIPNYVTVDSLMHTYHLYFSMLLNRTEKNYLADDLLALSQAMLETSVGQYELLVGTQWEEAARRNVAYFAVAAALQDPAQEIPADVAELVEQELALIYDAGGIGISQIGRAHV